MVYNNNSSSSPTATRVVRRRAEEVQEKGTTPVVCFATGSGCGCGASIGRSSPSSFNKVDILLEESKKKKKKKATRKTVESEEEVEEETGNSSSSHGCWTFRPTALSLSTTTSRGTEYYAQLSKKELITLYENDCKRAQQDVMVPSKPCSSPSNSDSNSTSSILRTCQWNVQCFEPWSLSAPNDVGFDWEGCLKTLLQIDADIIVLNEFGECGRSPAISNGDNTGEQFASLLERYGYQIFVATVQCPAAVAIRTTTTTTTTDSDDDHNKEEEERRRRVRLQLHGEVELLELDNVRGAVHVPVQVICPSSPSSTPNCSNSDSDDSSCSTSTTTSSTSTTSSSSPASTTSSSSTSTSTNNTGDPVVLHIYGTHFDHLDDWQGKQRLREAQVLLNEPTTKNDSNSNILIAGDFNQQRSVDYTAAEWEAICANKLRRNSPQTDGVDNELQQNGFECIWDSVTNDAANNQDGGIKTNWNRPHHQQQTQPPPATHWTGTVIDYTYHRLNDEQMKPVGVYVSPSGISDHRLVVCDWEVFSV